MRDRAGQTNWSAIGRVSVITSLVVALVVFFAFPDDRWISAVLVALAFVDGLIYTLVMPRLTKQQD